MRRSGVAGGSRWSSSPPIPPGRSTSGTAGGAAYGASIANILEAVGYDVEREYYVNDAGRQMHILALSVWLRYLERRGAAIVFPSNGYRGAYVHEIAARLESDVGGDFAVEAETVMDGVPADEPAGGDREVHVDALIARARSLLGPQRYERVFDLARDMGVDDIRSDLAEFGVVYDEWFSERSLVVAGDVDRVVARLRERGHVHERDGALWFRSTAFGDEKDRVVVRENGESTYFASDIAYAANKFDRGFERAIYVWGADHHGYIARVKGRGRGARPRPEGGGDPHRPVRQPVSRRGAGADVDAQRRVRRAARAARGGRRRRRAVLLRDAALRAAPRLRPGAREVPQQRQSRVLRAVCACPDRERAATVRRPGHGLRRVGPEAAFGTLVEAEAIALMRTLAQVPGGAGELRRRRSNRIRSPTYLREVATQLHGFYNAHTFLVDDDAVRGARLSSGRWQPGPCSPTDSR